MASVRSSKRRASPTFWTRRLRQATSSDIECDSPVRSPRLPRGSLPDPARDSLSCSPTAPWPGDSRFRTAGTAVPGAPLPQQAMAATSWVASRAIPQLLRLYSSGRAREPLPQRLGAAPPAPLSLVGSGPSACSVNQACLGTLPAIKLPLAPLKTGGDGDSSASRVGLPSTRCVGPDVL